jgi:hypothetical protein
LAQRGKPSIAHEYNERGECIHCSMYKVNVERSNHICKQWRENAVDKLEAFKVKLPIEVYRFGK